MMKKICNICGCKMGFSDKDCLNHCKENKKKDKNKDYDNRHRSKESTAFYKSKGWLMARKQSLSLANGLCLYSLIIDNKIVPADCVHHIIEVSEDSSLSLEQSNLIPLCSSVHSTIHTNYTDEKKVMLSSILKAYRDIN